MIDDPLKADEAHSDARRKSVNEWYDNTLRSRLNNQEEADVPLFVEHCEAVAAEIDVKLRWLGEQARRGPSVWSDALPVRHVMLEVACEPSVVGSL